MTNDEFRKFFSLVYPWIQETLASHSEAAKSVASLGFTRLPKYFSAELLESAKVVILDRVPTPPLSRLGISQFGEFEKGDFDGITYTDTFFIKRRHEAVENLYFHELVHVIQWKLLGPERFIASYADGLEKFGYRDSPLEKMAYDAQIEFMQSPNVFDVELLVAERLD